MVLWLIAKEFWKRPLSLYSMTIFRVKSCMIFVESLVFTTGNIVCFELIFRSIFYVLLKYYMIFKIFKYMLQFLYFLLLIPVWVFGATWVPVIDKMKELIIIYLKMIFQCLFRTDLYYWIPILTPLLSFVLFRKIVNGVNGKLLFCMNAMWLKTYSDGLVGMILTHLCAVHVLNLCILV